jgi:hypothetical protein
VVHDVVAALGGDVDRFQKLFELVDSERFGLGDRAEELGSELGLPASRQTRLGDMTVVSHGGAVYIQQAGGVPPFNPLTSVAPADIVSTYEAACTAHSSGAHAAAMGLVRSLVEAIGARETNNPEPLGGLLALGDRDVIPTRVIIKGEEVYRTASQVVRGVRPARADDSADALSFALALMACVYLDGRKR